MVATAGPATQLQGGGDDRHGESVGPGVVHGGNCNKVEAGGEAAGQPQRRRKHAVAMHERGDGDGNDDDGNDGDSDSDVEISYMIPRPSPRRHAILDRDRDRGCDDVLVEAMMAEIAELATRESRLVAELAASHRRECDLAQNLASMEQKYTDALSHLSLQHSGRGTPSRGSAGAPDVQEQHGCSAVTTGKVLATSAAWGERAQTTAKLVRRVVKKKVVPRSRAPPASEPAYILKTIGSDNDLDSGNGMDPGSVPARARLTALDYPPSHHHQPMHACMRVRG